MYGRSLEFAISLSMTQRWLRLKQSTIAFILLACAMLALLCVRSIFYRDIVSYAFVGTDSPDGVEVAVSTLSVASGSGRILFNCRRYHLPRHVCADMFPLGIRMHTDPSTPITYYTGVNPHSDDRSIFTNSLRFDLYISPRSRSSSGCPDWLLMFTAAVSAMTVGRQRCRWRYAFAIKIAKGGSNETVYRAAAVNITVRLETSAA